MGTHISKVKSVDLDAWTDDQIENMVKWGNANVNQYWEDKLPSGYIPDQLKIENFIRTKYDLRKWTMSKNLPDPLSLNKNKAATTATIQQPKHESKSHSNTTLLNDINLLDDNSGNKSNDEEFGSFTATRSPHKEVISWHHHLQRLCYLLHQQHQVHHNHNTNTNHFNLHKILAVVFQAWEDLI